MDYLESRPEIDTSTLGLTGCSGGGTMSSWLWAMEPRFTMAAPNCFVTTYLHNLENECASTLAFSPSVRLLCRSDARTRLRPCGRNGQDCEQCPPGVLGEGLENADLLLATNAGKPLLLTGERHDYFDREHCPEATDWTAPSCHATTCLDL